jgi:hypothetical protein
VGAWFDWSAGLGGPLSGLAPFPSPVAAFAPRSAGALPGLSFGGGYSIPVTQRGTLGLYGNLSINRHYSDAPDSPPPLYGYSLSTPFRTRFGGRYSHDFSPRVRGYFGLAWDQGFGGAAPAERTPRITLYGPGGASAFAELGLIIMALGDVDLGISTYGLSGETGEAAGGMSMVFSF